MIQTRRLGIVPGIVPPVGTKIWQVRMFRRICEAAAWMIAIAGTMDLLGMAWVD